MKRPAGLSFADSPVRETQSGFHVALAADGPLAVAELAICS